MELKITRKAFDAAPISALLREGEKAADTLVFVAPKQYGGLILGKLQWMIVGNYADFDDFAQQPLQAAETNDNVTLTWVPDDTFTAHPGGMCLWLEGRDNGTTVIKITANQRIAIAPTARKANAAFYAGMDTVLQQITAAAATAQTNADTAVQASNTANDMAAAAAKSAEDAQKAVEQATVRPLTKADIAELLAMI